MQKPQVVMHFLAPVASSAWLLLLSAGYIGRNVRAAGLPDFFFLLSQESVDGFPEDGARWTVAQDSRQVFV
jgi:hypothetical protein